MQRTTGPWLGTPREWAIDLAASGVAGVFLGVLGPFGSFFNDDIGVRVLYWVLAMALAAVVLGLVVRAMVVAAMRLGVPVVLGWAAGVVVGCAPLAALAPLLARAFWPRMHLPPLEWYGECLAISGPALLMRAAVVRLLGQTHGPLPLVAVDPLNPPVQSSSGPVICLRMEDHYVRVHTAAGSRLVAGPFERVIAGVGQEGMRVHRSWWVARAAVTGVVADGRNLRLTLTEGLTAPVSRASVARLREAGWLASEAVARK